MWSKPIDQTSKHNTLVPYHIFDSFSSMQNILYPTEQMLLVIGELTEDDEIKTTLNGSIEELSCYWLDPPTLY